MLSPATRPGAAVQPRRLPIGAELVPGGVHVRVWAPRRRRVEVVVEGGPSCALTAEADGYFSGLVAGVGAGALYRLRLDGDEAYPDPASRFQPRGPHGPSMVVDPRRHAWRDAGWRGIRRAGQVLYELHVGTFTPEGTWVAAARQLAALAELGVTTIALMPVAEFPGRFGWGYDGVDLFAPTRLYGAPGELRDFVDRAHAAGLAVVLDVVYSHLGPDGNYLGQFSDRYFTGRHACEWGAALDLDGPDSAPVREFVLANVQHWIAEYHLDGLRLDATQAIFDASPDPIVAAIARAARDAAPGREVLVIAENDDRDAALLRPPDQGGHGLDLLWSDDFHHSARAALTGQPRPRHGGHRGDPQELVSAIKRGLLYQGQPGRPGAPTWGLPPAALVFYTQNHDQVACTPQGRRGHELAEPGAWRAMTALLLLAPATPLLFQGQEFAASAPFHYFADHTPELAACVQRGRQASLPHAEAIVDPADAASFLVCKLDPAERERHAGAVALHRDLLRLRREDPVLREQGAAGLDGAVLGDAALVLRFFSADHRDDRLLLVNLGAALELDGAPEPLLAPPGRERAWALLWSSDHAAYGGPGGPSPARDGPLRLPARCALLLGAQARRG